MRISDLSTHTVYYDQRHLSELGKSDRTLPEINGDSRFSAQHLEGIHFRDRWNVVVQL